MNVLGLSYSSPHKHVTGDRDIGLFMNRSSSLVYKIIVNQRVEASVYLFADD